jgi:hypothetical protein
MHLLIASLISAKNTSEGFRIGNARDQRCRQRRPDARDRVQTFARRA